MRRVSAHARSVAAVPTACIGSGARVCERLGIGEDVEDRWVLGALEGDGFESRCGRGPANERNLIKGGGSERGRESQE